MTDPTALPNLSGPTEESPEGPLIDRIQEALRELGLEPRVDDEGDVEVKIDDQTVFIRIFDEQGQIFRVFGQWELQEPVPTDLTERLQACNDVNLGLMLAKTAIAGDSLLVASEHILPRGADLRGLLSLALQLTLHSVQLWHQRATGVMGEDAAGEGAPSDV